MIIITGGKGDIAVATIKKLQSEYFILAPDKRELDVSSVFSVNEFFKKIKDKHGKIDIIINNAGYISPDLIKKSKEEDWIRQVEVNLIGTYLCTKASIKLGATKIINIASTAGKKGKAEWSAYCSSKAGVISFSESLKDEGYDVDCLVIGRTNTKMRNALFPEEDKKTLATPESVAETIYKSIRSFYEKQNSKN